MERRCKSHEATGEIPSDIVIEILTRLPARSLMRLKSASKLWSSFICSLYFTNRFLKVSSSPPQLYLWLRVDDKPVLLSPSASPDSDGTTMPSFVVDQDVTIPSMEGYSVSHVFRGLMCFTNGQRGKIYNTTTRQLIVLPNIVESNIIAEDHEWMEIMYPIGHDPVHDQYKVVCTVSRRSDELGEFVTFLSEHWVLPLGGGDGSSRWRKIPSRCPPHLPTTQGLTINGRMHYLAWVRVPYQVLVTIDIHSEEISMLQAPEDHASRLPRFIDLIECSGRVALLAHIGLEEKGVMELWVMEDEEKNRWSKKTLVLHPSQMHMDDNVSLLRAQGTTRNGEVIFVPQSRTRTRAGFSTNLFYVFLFNLEKNHLRKVEIKETSNRYLTDIWDVVGLGDVENFMYL